MNLSDVVENINESKANIFLIYAFNGTGKTRLSVEYKDKTKTADGNHTGVYYNSYSEDLFRWNNDEEHDNEDVRLEVVYSSLNRYHSYIIESPEKLKEYLDKFLVRFYFKLNYNESDYSETGIESVSFYLDSDFHNQIKISRGEERIFIWCFFLTLFDVSDLANRQNAHFFIDDPVSSLDEHNIYNIASTIMDVVKKNYERKKVIITTHHVGLFSILIDRLRKGNGSERFKNITKTHILGKDSSGQLTWSNFNQDVFLLHLHLYKTIQENINRADANGGIKSYNFVLLRQLLENIASFLGKGAFSSALSRFVDNANDVAEIINNESHKDAYFYQTGLMSPEQAKLFTDVFNKITDTCRFQV